MRTRNALLAAAMIAALGACSRSKDGDIVVERPGDVDVKMTTDTLKLPDVGTRKDTINTPTMGTKPETLIVQKPVIGTKKTEVTVPTVKKPPTP
jgi:hypothetical protein